LRITPVAYNSNMTNNKLMTINKGNTGWADATNKCKSEFTWKIQ